MAKFTFRSLHWFIAGTVIFVVALLFGNYAHDVAYTCETPVGAISPAYTKNVRVLGSAVWYVALHGFSLTNITTDSRSDKLGNMVACVTGTENDYIVPADLYLAAIVCYAIGAVKLARYRTVTK